MITASIVVKKGSMKLDDVFVCGDAQGKIRQIKDDAGKQVKVGEPGRSYTIYGFKDMPDVGIPLYIVKTSEEANYVIGQRQKRKA